MIARASVVFPEPDSPTSARHSRCLSSSGRVVQDLPVAVEGAESLDFEQRGSAGCRRPRRERRETATAAAISADADAAHVVVRPDLRRAAARPRGRPRRVRAAWREDAARRPAPGAGTWPGIASRQVGGRDVRDRLDEPARVRVARPRRTALRRPGLDDAPGVHHEHALRQRRHGREVVADVDGADVVLAQSSRTVSSTCAWVVTSSPVVGSSRTISRGPQQERHGDADALLLTAGELVRISPQEVAVVGRRDLGERLADARAGLAALVRACARSPRSAAYRSSARG